MSHTIPGDGHTFAGHLLRANFDEIFHHDLPKLFNGNTDLTKVLQDGWVKLDSKVKDGLLHASGIVDTIANDLQAAPKDVIDSILAKFTDLKIEDLQAWLPQVAQVFTSVEASVSTDLYATVQGLQAYFLSHDKTKLGSILSVVMQTLAKIINPDGIVAQIATYAETAYSFIKALFQKK